MIEPKQKALEIVEVYINVFRKTDTCFTYCENSLKCQHSSYNCESWFETAKECAKIHVEEIIKASPSLPILGDSGTFGEDIELSKSYWQEVLNELNKM